MLVNTEKFISKNYFANWVNPNLEIRITIAKGRGVFTTKPIKCGEMIFAEKPITTWSEFIDMKRPDM